MATKKNGYVRRINCICYKELSQSLKIKYFMAVDENVAGVALERDSPCLNRCLLDFTTRKLRGNVSRFFCMDESHG